MHVINLTLQYALSLGRKYFPQWDTMKGKLLMPNEYLKEDGTTRRTFTDVSSDQVDILQEKVFSQLY